MHNKLLADDQERRFQYERSRSIIKDFGFDRSIKTDLESELWSHSVDKVPFVPIEKNDNESDWSEEDIVSLPPIPLFSSFRQQKEGTITNYGDFNSVEHNSNSCPEWHAKWENTPEKNDETERDELILYVQRNSRMTFAGIIKQHSLSEEYLGRLVRI